MRVYDNPKYYEVAFSFRNILDEVDFIEQVIKQHSGIPVKTILDIASGNSPHMLELCKRGYHYVGLELNDEMVSYAREKIRKYNLGAKVIKDDLMNFSILEPVDCAILFLGSLYVKDDSELIKHLSSLSKALRSGGLYILDGAIEFYPEDVRKQSWDIEREGIKVITTYDPRWIDGQENIVEAKITLEVEDRGEKKKIEHSEIRKIYSYKEFTTIAKQTGNLEYVDSFSNFDTTSKTKEGGRNIIVLRRK